MINRCPIAVSLRTLPGVLVCVVLVCAGGMISVFADDAAGTADHPPLKFRETPVETTARETMVREYIEGEGIKSPGVLESFRAVPRHLFVHENFRKLAYYDQSLPIGHSQTITPPFVVAYMTQTLDPRPEDRVLEIGTGSGFQAAILSRLVKEVYSIEIVDELAREATERLKRLGCTNVFIKSGDGYPGWPDKAPFDKIIVTCSPEKVPQPLIDQLKDGGKLIVPLGERYQQTFYLFEKQEGELKQTKLIPTLFVPMTGTSESQRTILPDGSKPQLLNGNFESSEEVEESLFPSNWHYLRQVKSMGGGAPSGEKYVRIENHDAGRFAQMLQAMPLDGRKIQGVKIDYWVRGSEIRNGEQKSEIPGVAIHFFDEQRKNLTPLNVQTWTGNFTWKQGHFEIKVPSTTREAILHFGLNGGTGQLDLDDVQMHAVPRSGRNSK